MVVSVDVGPGVIPSSRLVGAMPDIMVNEGPDIWWWRPRAVRRHLDKTVHGARDEEGPGPVEGNHGDREGVARLSEGSHFSS